MSDEIAPASLIDPVLLAKLTGALGGKHLIEKLSASFGAVYSEFLPDIIHSETGLSVTVGYAGCEAGYMTDLIANLGENVTLVDGSLRNWSPNVVLSCGNGFITALMEAMLGSPVENIEDGLLRPLSVIELDLAVMVFDKFADVLRSAVNAAGGFHPSLEPPHNIDDRAKLADDHVDEFAASVKMTITLGAVTSEFALVIPQKALLKTVVTVPKPKAQSSKSSEWSDQLSEQVRRSQVTLEARINLQPLTLGTIARLAVGDVIPFRDRGEVLVDVSANSKDMYICEFGRSGENYTVRVKDNINSDDELLRHLMN